MHHDHVWHAGELGCGDLVLELRMRCKSAPGKVFKVIALDAGASADIPAWCSMTGNPLLSQDLSSKTYWIRAKS
jgi:tRNA 2-thiouridine synthesizing protein A